VRPLLLVVVLAAAVAACGTPDELSQSQGRQLEISRDRVVAAVELHERLSESRAERDRILASVRKIVATGALEPRRLDEFGLAALGELRLVAPSLVIVDRLEVPRELDRPALVALLESARSDIDAATKIPAATEVGRIDDLLADADAGPDTQIPVIDTTVSSFRDSLAARLRPVWPDLADGISD
jgi:hypothetical protein